MRNFGYAMLSLLCAVSADDFRVVLLGEEENLSAPVLSRSSYTTPWLNRDKYRVTIPRGVNATNGRAGMGLMGSPTELAVQAYLTRHGLYRRSDAKFAEFIVSGANEAGDGYGLWRLWESHGSCPNELLIVDPWGSVSWEALDTQLRPIACSWVVRPGMYRHESYMKVSRAPVTIVLRTFSLLTDIEFLDVYDGAAQNATLIARFTGQRLPEQLTSSTPEVRLVLWAAELAPQIDDAWGNITDAVARGELRVAQRRFILAAQSGLRGFVRQDMRRILKTLAVQLSSKPEHAWMRRSWFAQRSGFDRVYAMELRGVLEDFSLWEKRGRHQEGKEGVAWSSTTSPRRYPAPMRAPEKNPYYPRQGSQQQSAAPQLEASHEEQLRQLLGDTPRPISGFSLDFVTTADCVGHGVSVYGESAFPPLTLSGTPESNFAFLPFPLEVSSCQPLDLSGPQVTFDRPFTIADGVMQRAQEDEMNVCIGRGACDVVHEGTMVYFLPSTGETSTVKISPLWKERGNCSAGCVGLMGCVGRVLRNRTTWVLAPNYFNKTAVMMARQHCLSPDDGASNCVNLAPRPYSRQSPKRAICLQLDCYHCSLIIYQKYFDCAIACGQDGAEPSTFCIDCSFGFQNLYAQVAMLCSSRSYSLCVEYYACVCVW